MMMPRLRPVCRKLFVALMSAWMLAGCAGLEKRNGPGHTAQIALQGYLQIDALPDSLALLPAPPAAGSAAFELDEAISRKSIALQGSLRWKLAAEDADLTFPQVTAAFSCALDAPITEQETPRLYRLLQHTFFDARLSTYAAKNRYRRVRPFVVNKAPTCTPEEETRMRNVGSYPSGHAALGWAWALILSELSPERSDAILARGWAYGQSRVLCNAHWQSDVMMGRMMGAAAVARLHADAVFRAAIKEAGDELETVRAGGLHPLRDCQAEADALAEYPPLAPWPANR